MLKRIISRKGRKYTMGMICMLMVLSGFALATTNPILTKVFAELVGGIVGIYMVYCGGNVGNKAVLGKWQGARSKDFMEQNPQENERGG